MITFLLFFSLLSLLLPNVNTGSMASTKSRSHISIIGNIVPTATKLPTCMHKCINFNATCVSYRAGESSSWLCQIKIIRGIQISITIN